MQCNTNYTNAKKNFKYLNINVLKTFQKKYKNKIILGLSDHTHGHTSVISAVTLGEGLLKNISQMITIELVLITLFR